MTDKKSPTQYGTVTVTDNTNGKTVELPILGGTLGNQVIDVRSLTKELGYFTFDPGYTSTACCESEITYIDGDKGELLHGGYSIEDLAENCDYLEVCHLLLYGELPNKTEFDGFQNVITRHTMLNERITHFYNGFRADSHPMAIMVGVVGALSSFYHDTTDIYNPEHRKIATHRMIAKIPTIAAMAYKYSKGQPFVYPRNEYTYAQNFLNMMFSLPVEDYAHSKTLTNAMNKIMILHADHEQNASTSTVRTAGSSGANPYACLSSGIASLWGPAHGGANEAVLDMLNMIGSVDRIPEFIKKAKDKNDPFRLMGFGHRVYKNYDPRAGVLKGSCHAVLEELGVQDEPLLAIAMELERIALEDEYFVDRKLFPNVDFYSGIILKAMGFETNMFTVLFALSRTVGWVSQWKEMIEDNQMKINRPRQIYTGAGHRAFIPMDQR